MLRLIRTINKVQLKSLPSFSKKTCPGVLEKTIYGIANFRRQLLDCRYVTTASTPSLQQISSQSSEHDTEFSETSAEEEGRNDDPKGEKSLSTPPKGEQTQGKQTAASRRMEIEANLSSLKFPRHYKVVCTSDPNRMNSQITKLLRNGETLFGLDIEWPPQFKKGQKQNRTALIQICGEDTILVFQVARLKSLPSELIRFLENPLLFKSGVNIVGDGNKLRKDFNVMTDGLTELDIMTRHIESPLLEQTNLRSLSILSSLFLKQKLAKTKSVRMSNWARPSLTPKQIEYAATDAYASYRLCVTFREILLAQNKAHITSFIIHLSKGQEKVEAKEKTQPQSETKEATGPSATQTTTIIIQKRSSE